MSNPERTMEIITAALEDIYYRLGWESKIIVEGDEVIGLIAGEPKFIDDFGDDDDGQPLN